MKKEDQYTSNAEDQNKSNNASNVLPVAVNQNVLDETESSIIRSSSYENIYIGTKLPGEELPEEIVDVDMSIVGDPFIMGHVELHLAKRPDGRSSSFENLYEDIQAKEATCIEDKDVDEQEEDETDLEKPEKGEKDVGDKEQNMCIASRLTLTFESSPIDITLEYGLDKIGHSTSETSPTLQHSVSYDMDTDIQSRKTRRFSTGSSPDEIAASDVEKSVTTVTKGTSDFASIL